MDWLDNTNKNKGAYMPPVLRTGDEFIATDTLKRKYRYRFIGITPAEPYGGRYIKLWNLSLNEETEVENEWFSQREIRIVHEEAAAGLSLEDILGKYFGLCGGVEGADWSRAYEEMLDCLAALSDLTGFSLGNMPDKLDEIEGREW